jgi:hypothetical protein
LRSVARLLEFAQNPLQAPVLLKQLQRSLYQRLLLLPAAAPEHSAENVTEKSVQHSHALLASLMMMCGFRMQHRAVHR